MNRFENIADSVFFLRAPDQIVSQVEVHRFRRNLESFDGEIDLLPATKALFDFNSESDRLFFEVGDVRIFFDVYFDSALFVIVIVGLELECDLYGFIVEFYLFLKGEISESIFEMSVDHKFGFFTTTK